MRRAVKPVFCLATCFCFLISCPLRAQPLEGGARSAALAGAGVALGGDVWGQENPASRSTVERPSAAFFVSQGYGMAELRVAALSVVLPMRAGTFSTGGQTFGFDDFRQSHFALGYARGLPLGPSRKIHVGVDARYHHVAIDTYGQAGAASISAGWIADVAPGLFAGVQATNLNGARFSGHDALDRTLSAGIAYRPSEALHALLSVVKDVRFPASVRTGIEARLVPAFSLRAGVGTAPVQFAVGTGLQLRNLSADIAAVRHDVLGWTPGISVALSW